MNSHQDDYLLKTRSKTYSQASHFALIKFSFAYFKQPKQILLLKMEPSLDPFFCFFSKQFNFYGDLGKKRYQGLSTYPSSTVTIVDEHLMLVGMKLTSTTTFKETRMTVLQFLQTAK